MRVRMQEWKRSAEFQARCVIGEFPVHLRTHLRKLHKDFTALYPQRSPANAWSNSQEVRETLDLPEILIEVQKSGRSRLGQSLYRVTANGHELGAKYPARSIFPLVEWGINLRVIETGRSYIQFHAASMALDGCGFVFAGDSGCGKSTLAAMLLSNQAGGPWQYLCDEFALVDARTLQLHPFPKALCIKAGSIPAIRQLELPLANHRHYVKAYKGPVSYLNPRDLGPHRIAGPVPVRFVIFPSYARGAAACLTPMSRAQAVTELYRSCFNKLAHPSGGVPLIVRMVRGAKCFRLTVGEAKETSWLLASLIDSTQRETKENTPNSNVAATKVALSAPTVTNKSKSGSLQPHRLMNRRELLKVGVKVAFVTPAVMTLTSRQAFAAASNPSGICSTATQTGGLCETDLDCCSRQCNLGVCK